MQKSSQSIFFLYQDNENERHHTSMTNWPGDAKGQQTTFGGLSRSALMSRVRSRGNKSTEQRLATLLRKSQITGWQRHQALPGHPDFVWKRSMLAVFVDGCFWHGHPCRNTESKTNAQAWRNKISKNKKRDRLISRGLRAEGWTVVRIWECQLRHTPEKCITRIQGRLS
jgi:DNA mismatch endonuclease (patch repair protein)